MERIRFTTFQGHFLFARARTRIYSSAAVVLAAALILFPPASSAAAVLTFAQASHDLNSSDLARRYAAIVALKNFGPQGAAPIVAVALGSETDLEFRLAMLDTLASLHDFSVVPAIAPITKDPNAMLRQRAVYTIGLLGGPQAETILTDLLKKESDVRIRTTALQGLSVCGSARSVPAIQAALEDSRPDVRAHAFEALRAIPGPAASAALKAHNETDPKLKRRMQDAMKEKQNGAQ